MFRISGIILILLFPVISWSQTVTGHTGSFSEGSNVTLHGSLFGPNGPHIELFDNFESGSNGDEIAIGDDSATVGGWTSNSGSNTTYSNYSAHSGNLAFRADQSNSWVNPMTKWFTGVREIFISWWLFLPAEDNWPGEGDQDGINWKQMWITGEDTGDDDMVVPTRLGATSWLINGNDSTNAPYAKSVSDDMNFVKGEWHHLAIWYNGGASSDGNVHMWRLASGSGNMDQIVDDNNITNFLVGAAFERVGVNLYGRQTDDCHPTFDDVYIAIGDYARARVELGDQPLYYDCTEMAICTPVDWNSTSITTTIHTGAFEANDLAYIFVTDSEGNVSSPGYEITISPPSGTNDLALSMNVDDNTPDANTLVTFAVTLTNNGPEDGTGIEVTDLLPAGLTYVSSNPSVGSYNGSTGVWSVGSLTNANSATLSLVATVDADSYDTTIINTAIITAAVQADSDHSNNEAIVTLVVNPNPNPPGQPGKPERAP